MGRLFRQSHEIALVCTRGTPHRLIKNKSQRSVAFDLNVGHSVKPNTLHERLETMYPTSTRLEMFARRHRAGWTCVGNELTGNDINVDMTTLASQCQPHAVVENDSEGDDSEKELQVG